MDACAKAAVLIENGGKRFKEEVKAEANRQHKSRFMGEMNKAKNTWFQKGYDSGHEDGVKQGYDLARDRFQITYPCAVCGVNLVLRPDGEATKSAVEHLKSEGWRHTDCKKA